MNWCCREHIQIEWVLSFAIRQLLEFIVWKSLLLMMWIDRTTCVTFWLHVDNYPFRYSQSLLVRDTADTRTFNLFVICTFSIIWFISEFLIRWAFSFSIAETKKKHRKINFKFTSSREKWIPYSDIGFCIYLMVVVVIETSNDPQNGKKWSEKQREPENVCIS